MIFDHVKAYFHVVYKVRKLGGGKVSPNSQNTPAHSCTRPHTPAVGASGAGSALDAWPKGAQAKIAGALQPLRPALEGALGSVVGAVATA